jgi:hypothetical protein
MKKTDKILAAGLFLLIAAMCFDAFANADNGVKECDEYCRDKLRAEGRIARLSEEWRELEEKQAELAEEAAQLRKDFDLAD